MDSSLQIVIADENSRFNAFARLQGELDRAKSALEER